MSTVSFFALHCFFADGEVVVTKGGCVCRSLGAGGVFGELAILYGCLRSATVEGERL